MLGLKAFDFREIVNLCVIGRRVEKPVKPPLAQEALGVDGAIIRVRLAVGLEGVIGFFTLQIVKVDPAGAMRQARQVDHARLMAAARRLFL